MGYEKYIVIERHIPEYANNDLTHNVEFTLHPSENTAVLGLAESELPFTVAKIKKKIDAIQWQKDRKKILNCYLPIKY